MFTGVFWTAGWSVLLDSPLAGLTCLCWAKQVHIYTSSTASFFFIPSFSSFIFIFLSFFCFGLLLVNLFSPIFLFFFFFLFVCLLDVAVVVVGGG